jgi:hypothetical protein
MDDKHEDADENNSAFVDKFGKLIDDLNATDVNTRETFDFIDAADEGEPFSVMNIERIVGDLFGLRLRFAMAMIAMRAANNLIRPKTSWDNGVKDVKSSAKKIRILLSIMESLEDDDEEDDDEDDDENTEESTE